MSDWRSEITADEYRKLCDDLDHFRGAYRAAEREIARLMDQVRAMQWHNIDNQMDHIKCDEEISKLRANCSELGRCLAVVRGERCSEQFYGIGDGPCGQCVKCLRVRIAQLKGLPMASLYIRDIPDSLMRALRVKAATEGLTIKQLVLPVLSESLNVTFSPTCMHGKSPDQVCLKCEDRQIAAENRAIDPRSAALEAIPDRLRATIVDLSEHDVEMCQDPSCKECRRIQKAGRK